MSSEASEAELHHAIRLLNIRTKKLHLSLASLLQPGADPNAYTTDTTLGHNVTILVLALTHLTNGCAIAKLLLEYGANPHWNDNKGRSAL